MRIWQRVGCLMLVFCLVCSGCTPRGSSDPLAQERSAVIPLPDLVRAVWLSYLELDRAFSGATAQAAEEYIDRVMARCADSGINTVFFHVRAHSDAYYASDRFPAADSAKGLLASGFDPLSYAIEAAHKRGISLHAWINPYRIGEERGRAVCEDVFELSGSWYYIPTSKEAQRCILAGVREVVERYPVDGVQFDDYFYPAALGEEKQAFEQPAGSLSVADFRKAAVSALVASVYSTVHTRKNCVFGISPAGNVARCVEQEYADVPRWLKFSGYIDYLCPQLYSGFENSTRPFLRQMEEFSALPRADGVRLLAGLALYKAGASDTFAGSGASEWQNGGDILSRQAQAAEEAGYTGVALFRFSFWETPANEVSKQEISALISYFYTE